MERAILKSWTKRFVDYGLQECRADEWRITPGTRDPDHVHPEHARLDHSHQDEAGVRAPPLRFKAQDRRRPHLQQPCRIPGTCPLVAASIYGQKE
jgi:hypothetical protein